MHKLLNPVYRDDPEPKRTFKLLRRFQATRHLPRSPPLFLVVDIEVEPVKVEGFMKDNKIIGIANDMVCNIRDYVFDPNAMNTNIIRPAITVTQIEFKPMMF